jgi:hypothetical protein
MVYLLLLELARNVAGQRVETKKEWAQNPRPLFREQ